MRQVLFVSIFLFLLSFKAFAQQNLDLTQLDNSCDTLVVRSWVWFSIGYQSTCPPLSHFETIGNSDTMELKLYYNVSGPWPQVGCDKVDTIITPIFPNVTVLRGTAISINDNDTTAVSTAQIPICSPTGIKTMNNDAFSKSFPNPFSDEINFELAGKQQATVVVYDLLGQRILQQTFRNTATIKTAHLSNGIYFYELRNDQGAVSNGKVLKQ